MISSQSRTGVLALAVFALVAGLAMTSPAFAQFNAFKDPTTGGKSAGGTTGPDLEAVTEKIDAGKVTVGSTAYVVALFKNSGTSDVKVEGINLYPSSTVSADVTLNKCAEQPLPPEGECAVTVAVTGLQIGSWRVEILLDHDGRTRLATASLTGTTEGMPETAEDKVKPDLEAVPAELDFGTATGGLPLVKSVLLRNRTAQKMTIKDISLDTPAQTGFVIKPACPETLQSGESCNVAVTWTPLAKGESRAVLVALHSAISAMTQVAVVGKFEPTATANAEIFPDPAPDSGLLISDRKEIDFGTTVKGASAITASLVNTGSKELTLRSIRLAGSDSGLSVARSGCQPGMTLQPTDACALTVNWVPSREGSVIDDLQVQHTGARGVLILPIRGAATEAVSRETLAVRQSGDGSAVSVTPVLDGYVVTSHSPVRAVINGPVGSLVVRDGEDVVISGVRWTVTIIPTGVILSSEEDQIMLVFDKSLKPNVKATTPSSSDTSSTTTDTNNSTATTSSSGG